MSDTNAPLNKVVLFLDVDGVLLPVPRFTFGGGDLSVSSIRILSTLIHRCGGTDCVTLILSSTWRNYPEYIKRLNKAFDAVNIELVKTEEAAMSLVPHISGGTPNGVPKPSVVKYLQDDPTEQRLVKDRVDEIERWIRTHMKEHPEACGGRWLAIDDMDLGLDERMKDHFLKTETEGGLAEENKERAFALIDALPSPAAARELSNRALIDPAIKDVEIGILEEQRDRLDKAVQHANARLKEANGTIAELQGQLREQQREHKQMERRLEDVSYRLAVYDFCKRLPALREAVDLSQTLSGAPRKEIDAQIKRLVDVLRERKELQKQENAQRKQQKHVKIIEGEEV